MPLFGRGGRVTAAIHERAPSCRRRGGSTGPSRSPPPGAAATTPSATTLRLNSCRPLSHLPGRPFPKGTRMFPARDQLVDYLDHHAHEDGVDLQLGTDVERIERADGGWTVHTSAGDIHARQALAPTLPGSR